MLNVLNTFYLHEHSDSYEKDQFFILQCFINMCAYLSLSTKFSTKSVYDTWERKRLHIFYKINLDTSLAQR